MPPTQHLAIHPQAVTCDPWESPGHSSQARVFPKWEPVLSRREGGSLAQPSPAARCERLSQWRVHMETSRIQCSTSTSQCLSGWTRCPGAGAGGHSHGGSCDQSREGTGVEPGSWCRAQPQRPIEGEGGPSHCGPLCEMTIVSLSSWAEMHILAIFIIYLIEQKNFSEEVGLCCLQPLNPWCPGTSEKSSLGQA